MYLQTYTNSAIFGVNIDAGSGVVYALSLYSLGGLSQLGGEVQWSGTGSTSHADYGANGDWYIRSGSSVGKVILQDSGCNVGIGTATPYAKLHVVDRGGAVLSHSHMTRFDHSISSLSYSTYNAWLDSAANGLSIFADHDIATNGWMPSSNGSISSSDRRIKTNIVDADDVDGVFGCASSIIPKEIHIYKDTYKHGEEGVWCFIAQEIRDTFPYATQLRKEIIRNINEVGAVPSNVINFTDFNTSNLEANAYTVEVYSKQDEAKKVTIT